MPKTENINIRIEPELKNRNNFDETEFVKVVSMLSNGETLPPKYCNHILEPKSERILWMSYKTWLVKYIRLIMIF